MIRAIIFDLDGTLVQSERLKAKSYAIAAQGLLGLPDPDPRAIEAYREVVGSSRDVASRHVMESLELDDVLRPLMVEYGVSEPEGVLSAMRKRIYDDMVADPQVLRDNQWPHTIQLLRLARDASCRTALATMSYRKEVMHVLRALELEASLDAVLTREDVVQPKPAPEIYELAASTLGVPPDECLVLEDSPNGVRAAVSAGMNVIAVATPFTQASLHSSQVLEHAWIVHTPEELLETVKRRIDEHNLTAHSETGTETARSPGMKRRAD